MTTNEQWCVLRGFSNWQAVQLVKETECFITHIDTSWTKVRQTRRSKSDFLTWRGSKDDAERIVVKLTSAKAEHNRRVKAANEWYKDCHAKILAEFPSDDT